MNTKKSPEEKNPSISFDMISQDRRWNAEKPSATLDP